MLTVHHLGISQSDRIVWLCEELGIAYELVRHERDPVTRMAPESYRALHPFGTAPVVTDGDLVLGESGAIVQYLLARHDDGTLAPAPDDPRFADYLFWFHFANASMMPAGMMQMVAARLGHGPESEAWAGLSARAERAHAMVEARLGEAPFLTGDTFTAADLMMHFPLTTMRVFVPRDLSGYPNILAYLQRVAARPAWQRAMEKADPGFAVPLT